MRKLTVDERKAYLLCAADIASGSKSLEQADDEGFAVVEPVFTVGQVSELAVIHPQTLRQYDRLGLVVPNRTAGGARRYSLRDIDRLTTAQHLAQDEAINLAGVMRILSLMEENRQLRRENSRLRRRGGNSFFSAAADGQVVEVEVSASAYASAYSWRKTLYRQPLQITSATASVPVSAANVSDVPSDVPSEPVSPTARVRRAM